jgi:NAD(P)-dependent dehydrogenase (short-subunit alcohol dehydrogenase family)
MEIRLDGKRALVTGANSGLGEAMAVAFADAGADVAVNYVAQPEKAEALVNQFKAKGRRAVALEADVSDPSAVARMFSRMDEALGGVDILVANAGVDGHKALSWESEAEQWERVIRINLLGAYYCAREALKRMTAQRSGVVLCTSSVHEVIAWSGYSAYTASKGGMNMMAKTMAQEAGEFGVRVLCVAPGAIATPINSAVLGDPKWQEDLMGKVAIKRVGKTDDVADLALFLVSDHASYMTGTTVFVDGGMTDYPAFAHGG